MSTVIGDFNKTEYPLASSRTICRAPNGDLWTMLADTATSLKAYRSTDDGATWAVQGSAVEQSDTSPRAWALYVDLDGYLHIVTALIDGGQMQYYRGTWNGSSLTWSSGHFVAFNPTEADIVAHRHGSGWKVHVFYRKGTTSGMFYDRINIASDGTPTNDTPDQSVLVDNNNNGFNYPCIDFHHTGDGVTVKSSLPHVFLAWYNNGTAYFQKWTYNGSTWVQGSARVMQAVALLPSPINMTFDGTEVVVVYQVADTPQAVRMSTRDVADTTTLVLDGSTNQGETLTDLGIAHDRERNIYIVARAATSNDVYSNRYDKVAGTWGGWELIEATTTDRVNTKNGYYSGTKSAALDVIWRETTASPDDIRYLRAEVFSVSPSAPNITAPSTGAVADVDEELELVWVFSDPDPGDSQGSYSVRRKEGSGGTYEYFNGTTWQSSEDASTKIASATTELTFAAGWGDEADADHYYSVKVWDSFDAGPSAWSAEVRVVPSEKVNPAITDPASDGAIIEDGTYPVVWTAAQQTRYRVRTWPDSGGLPLTTGTPEFDTGVVINSVPRTVTVSFPTNMVTRHIEVTTWNTEGLESDPVYREVDIAYTPPATPTATVQAGPHYIQVAVTNPAPTGDEPNPLYNDIHRREVGEEGDGVRVASGVGSEHRDYKVASGTAYEYRAEVIADNGATAFSAWVS